jgi:Domain of unknown function (DUF1707)
VHVTNPGLRASDADRQRVVTALERHTAAGRLTLDEFGDRVAQVLRAATLGDLAAVTGDLPPDQVHAEEAALATQRALARQLVFAFALAVVALVVLGTALALGR